MKYEEKKKEIASKMHKKSCCGNHAKHGHSGCCHSKKGKESLNPIQKGQDNMEEEGKDEEEKE